MSYSVLITGANGFVGSHILESLMKIGHSDLHIIAACRNRKKLIPEFKGEVREGDLRDENYLDHVLVGVDIICHAATWMSLWSNKQLSSELYLTPTLNLIDKALEWKVKRFVNASSIFTCANKTSNPHEPGKCRTYWPHLCNMIEIENHMRDHCNYGCNMVNLRLGIFAGKRNNLGLLPVLINRFRTHLFPWVSGGKHSLPIIDGQDIGQAFSRAALVPVKLPYESFNITGPEVPDARTVFEHMCKALAISKPQFSLPSSMLFFIAWFNETSHKIIPGEPFITRSMIHMLQGNSANNERAIDDLGYKPDIHWKQAIQDLVEDYNSRISTSSALASPAKELDL